MNLAVFYQEFTRYLLTCFLAVCLLPHQFVHKQREVQTGSKSQRMTVLTQGDSAPVAYSPLTFPSIYHQRNRPVELSLLNLSSQAIKLPVGNNSI